MRHSHEIHLTIPLETWRGIEYVHGIGGAPAFIRLFFDRRGAAGYIEWSQVLDADRELRHCVPYAASDLIRGLAPQQEAVNQNVNDS